MHITCGFAQKVQVRGGGRIYEITIAATDKPGQYLYSGDHGEGL